MERLDLGGTWSLTRRADGSIRPMELPGDILSALLAAGEIPDPYQGENELALQWIGREDWLLTREFAVPPALAAAPQVFLDLEVLDSLAEVRLNGELLGSQANMFRRFRADLRHALRQGANRLEILIRSPERAAVEAAAALPYPIPASTYPVSSPHRNLLRKAQCMGGWDWGPCLMTGGVYDGAALTATRGVRIEHATTRMRREGRDWKVLVEVEVLAGAPLEVGWSLSLAGATLESRGPVPSGASRHEFSLLVRDPALWWPAGLGEQPLHGLSVELAVAGVVSHRLEKRIGFRELAVVAEEDEAGRSLRFRVNGRDLFAKGANWIPADALPSRWTRSRIDELLSSAVAANMNMLRVWGGGRYESEDFYGLCDEKGLLVWQDFMFSCALYPSSPEFLGEVEAEVRHQVRRLKDHPCLALWCGNNEALGAITWYEESRKNPARYIVDYDRLTEGTVGRLVRELDPDRTWWPSSPSAGPNDFSDNWHADNRGDMHYWTVWHEGKSFSAYLDVKPRFCSEFGFQSLPSARTAASFCPPGELNVTSPAFEHHQRHPRGNTIILETMSRYFRMPRGFRETLWLSQVQQALAIKTAVEYWRSLRPRCMGTLFWQLNDVWPAASWSSLEYDGSWKLLHHEARRFYDPVLLALHVKDGHLHAVGVNDLPYPLHGDLALCLRRFDGSLVMDIATDGDLAPEAATLLWRAPLASLPADPREVYLAARLEAAPAGQRDVHIAAVLDPEACAVDGVPSHSAGKAPIVRRSQLFLTEPKRCALADPRLEARVEEGRPGEGPVVLLRSRAPAFWVTPEAEDLAGRFEDAGFYMLGGEERRLRFIPARGAEAPTAAALAAALRVTHLRASYD